MKHVTTTAMLFLVGCTIACQVRTDTMKVNDSRGSDTRVETETALSHHTYEEFDGRYVQRECMRNMPNESDSRWLTCFCLTTKNPPAICGYGTYGTFGSLYSGTALDPLYIQSSFINPMRQARVTGQISSKTDDKKQNVLIQQTELMRKEQEQIGNNLKKFNERIKTLEETQKTEGK